MYKKLPKNEFKLITDDIKEKALCSEKKNEDYFKQYGCGFKCITKNCIKQYYEKKNEITVCCEITLYNKDENTVKSCNSKKFCKFLYKYKYKNGVYYFKKLHDPYYSFVLKSFMYFAKKFCKKYFFKEHLFDFFFRFFSTKRSGEYGNIYKGKNLETVKIILVIFITLLAAVIRGLQEGRIYGKYGWM